MAKGTISPFLEAGSLDMGRRGRSNPSFEPIPSSVRSEPMPSSSSRSSLSSKVVFPYLRRLDTDDGLAHRKTPLLTLKLSSPSFLDSVVNDDLTTHPLYVIKTVGTSTSVTRSDPWKGYTKTADIKWPKIVPTKTKGRDTDGVLIQMGGARWKGGETLLRPGTFLSGPKKFTIPNYSHNMKWRRVGNSYWCTTSNVKGPIATLDPAANSMTPQLNIYETLHDKYDNRALLVHHGVSLLLLDYVLVTALLLVTDVQEWMVVKKYEGKDAAVPPPSVVKSLSTTGPKSAPGEISTSASQWRKVIYGEPIYPKRSMQSLNPNTSHSPPVPPTPTSADQMAKIMYGAPIYPSLRTPSPAFSSSASESDSDENEGHYAATSRAPSPSAESIIYPLANTSAPSHGYLDPSFYREDDIPPVPPIPARYGASGSTFSHFSRSVTPTSTSSRRPQDFSPRDLPPPPPLPTHPRSRSTPPIAVITQGVTEQLPPEFVLGASTSLPGSRRPSNFMPNRPTRTHSVSARPLPQPPTPTADGRPTQGHGLRHVQSQSPLPNKRMSQYGGRSLPPTPISSSGGRPEDASINAHQRLNHTVKSSAEDLSQWVNTLTTQPNMTVPSPRVSFFDHPPPAYNSINFSAGNALAATPMPPPPPPPRRPSTAR